MSVAPARRAALQVLKRVRERDAFGPETLDAVLAASGLSQADQALATRLTYGTLQTQGVLDEAIDRLATRPGDIEPRVRDALRLTAYEILFARTPPRAAVHQGVEAVRAARPQASGLANALLRRLAGEAPSFPWGDPEADDEALARLTGHPRWLVDLMIVELGREAAQRVLRSQNEPAPLYLWHNPFAGEFGEALAMLEDDGADPESSEPQGCILARNASAAVRGATLAQGRCLVCDAAAQVAALAVGPWPAGAVVDLAAGRGTKTVQMQAASVRAGGPCRLYAIDLHPFKTEVLARRMERLGVPGVTVLTGDATDVAGIAGLPEAGTADAVLLDAPCSGLGTLRRGAEKRWRLRPSDLDGLVALQSGMLAQAATMVRPGGVLVYSTCSISRRENHEVVSDFLRSAHGSEFRTGDLSSAVPETWRGWIGPEGWFQSLPDVGGPDGHFVARLDRA